MKIECDGGGNRYQSFPTFSVVREQPLINYFNGRQNDVPAGVCSLLIGTKAWIVCPRRLFTLERGLLASDHERLSVEVLKKYIGLKVGQRIGIWSEVKIKYPGSSAEDGADGDDKLFDYTFDYIVVPLGAMELGVAAKRFGMTPRKLENLALRNKFQLSSKNNIKFIEDYPAGSPYVIEVMTSSTSGGNKRYESTMQDAFKKAALDEAHEAPGINYRQVWARMVSQLIVKSQIGKEWGGATLWVLQDELAKYISRTTDLNLQKLISQSIGEVNILSLGLSGSSNPDGTLAIGKEELYAGRIPAIVGDADFNKLLQAASIPPRHVLDRKLLSKEPRVRMIVG